MVIKNSSKNAVEEHAHCESRLKASECKQVCRGSSSWRAVSSPVQSRREAHAPHGAPLVHKWRHLPIRNNRAAFSGSRSKASPSPLPLVVCTAPTPPATLAALAAGVHTRDATCEAALETEAQDVIDLGAPRRLRRTPTEPLRASRRHHATATYTPNPRLYPGTRPKTKLRKTTDRLEPRSEFRGRRNKRVFRRPVPNARLYRPAPRPPPPPPARPRAAWPPPGVPAHSLDTASRVALQFSEQRRVGRAVERSRAPPQLPNTPKPTPSVSPVKKRSPLRSRRLVVTLPATTAAGDAPPRYHPASEHFKSRDLDTTSGQSTPAAARPRTPAMDAANRHSTSPEDCSDGNETLSAPSEFLAEFLSAIMGRQYAEALKYCRLILQYEPHNSTARGFYPLLQHKVLTQGEPGREECPRDSSSESARSGRARRNPRAPRTPRAPHSPPPNEEVMEQEADQSVSEAYSRSHTRSHSSGSCGSQSSLELDSSEALQHSSGSPSLSISRRTDHTDSASAECGGSGASGASGGSGVSGARCSSGATDTDDNGNAPPTAAAASLRPGDENDNAAAAGEPHHHLKRESSSLRRLRAQFACSIK